MLSGNQTNNLKHQDEASTCLRQLSAWLNLVSKSSKSKTFHSFKLKSPVSSIDLLKCLKVAMFLNLKNTLEEVIVFFFVFASFLYWLLFGWLFFCFCLFFILAFVCLFVLVFDSNVYKQKTCYEKYLFSSKAFVALLNWNSIQPPQLFKVRHILVS